jgi:phytoene desaturase
LAEHFDAIVIGAGAGGLCTAARLAHRGYKTLVVEQRARVGGRASTYELDGFKINEGAIVLEVGTIFQQTCEEVGAKFDVRMPDPPVMYRIGKKDIDVTGGGWGFLLSKLTRQGAKLVQGIGAAKSDDGALPDGEMSTAQWVARYTKNENVHAIFRNMCANVFAVGSEELPARVFLTFFTRRSAFKKFGFCPQGTIGPYLELADVVRRHGGEVWLSSSVSKIHSADGKVTGATIQRDGENVEVTAPVVVSNVGPAATLDLVGQENLPFEYVQQVKDKNRPCAMISVNFASEKPLLDLPGLLSFGVTRRLCYVANFTATCPEMAPPGWHLYVGTGVPKPSIGDFDERAETELVLADLHDQIPGFDQARILNIAVTRDDWPPQRAVAGFDLPYTTPIPNLWNVGDAVKEYANGGTTACAETAKLVAEEIMQRHPLGVRA